MAQDKEAGTLYDVNLRTQEYVRAELDKAFSCEGKYAVNMNVALEKARQADDTMLVDVKSSKYASSSRTGHEPLWTFGYNIDDQLGVGAPLIAQAPVQVRSLSSWIQVSGEGYHTIALKF